MKNTYFQLLLIFVLFLLPNSSLAQKFSIGDRVYVSAGPLNVRATPSTSGTVLGSQATNAQGTVVGGPTVANGYTWWNINYDISPDGWSVENYLEKISAPAPSISSVSPNPVTGSNSQQPFTIYGSNFVSGCNVTLRTGGSTYANRTISSFSSTQIVINPNFTTTAATWTVEVINPDGQSSGQYSFSVVAPAPAPSISSVSPNPVTGSNSQQPFTIYGNNFVSGCNVTLRTGGSTYANRTISSFSSTQIVINPNFTTTAATWTVEVINPDGQSSGQYSFSVVAPAPAPSISSVSPNPVTGSNSQQPFTIYGNNFVSGCNVTLRVGGSTYPNRTISSFSSTQIVINPNFTTTAQTWSVEVINPDGQSSGQYSFNVVAPAPAPSITSVSPNPVTGSNSQQPFTIYGSNFVSGCNVTLRTGGSTYPNRTISSFSSTQIVINPNFTTTVATWTVEVINPDGQSSGQYSFSVVAPAPAPSISSVSPNPITGSNSQQPFTIYGSNFVSGCNVTLRTGGSTYPNRTISSFSSTQIVINPNFTTTAATWTVEVINPDGQSSGQYSFNVVAPSGSANPIITVSLTLLEAAPFTVGQTVTATFTITNKGNADITFDVLTVGGRINGDNSCSNVSPKPNVNTSCADFTWRNNITLSANQGYDFQGTLTFGQAGNYHFFIAYRLQDQTWNTNITTDPGISNTYDLIVTMPETAPLLYEVSADAIGDRIPLILIHGWNKGAIPGPPMTDIWSNFLTYFNSNDVLKNAFKPYYFSYYSNVTSVFDIGAMLRDALDSKSVTDRGFSNKKIVILSHSMGGLIARSLMQQHWYQRGAFAGIQGGERVLELITLGTPHHGTPLANGPARDDKAGVAWGATMSLYDGLFNSGPKYDQLNRTDLYWDNYDGLLDYSTHPSEKNDWLANELNSSSTYDNKLIVYAGVISPPNSSTEYDLGSTILGGVFGLANDGAVPLTSAQFDGHIAFSSTRYFSDYSHSEIVSGKGSNDIVLFDRIKQDLLAPQPIQLASFTAQVLINNNVKLEWTTISETNNYGFYVERKDSLHAYSTISDLIPGAGTSLEQHNYSWTDSTVTSTKYYYRLKQVDLNGDFTYSQEITVSNILGIQNEKELPKTFALEQNYPNPFNPSTVIRYQLPVESYVTLKIFNMLGQEVVTLANGVQTAGYKSVEFDAGKFPSGVYVYRLTTGTFSDTKKMLILK